MHLHIIWEEAGAHSILGQLSTCHLWSSLSGHFWAVTSCPQVSSAAVLSSLPMHSQLHRTLLPPCKSPSFWSHMALSNFCHLLWTHSKTLRQGSPLSSALIPSPGSLLSYRWGRLFSLRNFPNTVLYHLYSCKELRNSESEEFPSFCTFSSSLWSHIPPLR